MSALHRGLLSRRTISPDVLLRHHGRRHRNLKQASVTREDAKTGGVRVAVLTADGQSMVEKTGFVSPDGARCFVKVFGERVQATLESGRWVYRVPKREDE